jgi:uncharacterized protein (UPF0276 family)
MQGNLEPPPVGIGLRQPHYRQVIDSRPPLAFVEVHSENFFFSGGPARAVLAAVRAIYPVSLHGVGLSLGSADGLDADHLEKLADLIDRVDPLLVSEHLCWGRIGAVHHNDLLPLPATRETLAVVAENVDRVQSRLKRRIAIENVSAYLRFRHVEMTEAQLLAELAGRTGCGILFDVNNLYVNAVNHGFDPLAEMARLPRDAVLEMHLAGHACTEHGLIDDHGSRVCDDVWRLYDAALERFGPAPTLIEWDTDIPALDVLLGEAARARGAMTELAGRAPAAT